MFQLVVGLIIIFVSDPLQLSKELAEANQGRQQAEADKAEVCFVMEFERNIIQLQLCIAGCFAIIGRLPPGARPLIHIYF